MYGAVAPHIDFLNALNAAECLRKLYACRASNMRFRKIKGAGKSLRQDGEKN